MFPETSFEYLPEAIKIMEKFLATYGSESKYFETEGKLITSEEEV